MRLPTLVYLLGAPGVGKSTLMKVLTAGCGRLPVEGAGVPHELLFPAAPAEKRNPVAAEIGRTRSTFSGTDATAMNIHPRAVAWIEGVPYGLVLAEGARLGTASFLVPAARAGYRVVAFHLTATPDELARRRAARGCSTQSPAWAAGAATRAARTAETVGAVELDTCALPQRELAATVRRHVPELEVLL